MKCPVEKSVVAAAAVFGLASVVAGALGAHPPEGFFPSERARESWNSAVIFQMFHALALLAVSGLPWKRSLWIRFAQWFFVAGTLLFSGSIFALALGGPRILGPVTPLGGLGLIVGWGCLLVGVLRAGDNLRE